MKILYIFPHPDDESFGPAGAINQQIRNGHEVYLLTLTKGGATKMRHKFGYSIEEMGEVRVKEMECVAKVLNLSGMEILDYTDGGLADVNPIELETLIQKRIDDIKPNVLVTYAVHGISGHHDHLTIHPIVKRLFESLRSDPKYTFLKRLAFFTMPETENEVNKHHKNLNKSSLDKISCIVKLNEEDIQKFRQALDCYETYKDVIEETKVFESTGDKVHFELYGESPEQTLTQITDSLPNHLNILENSSSNGKGEV